MKKYLKFGLIFSLIYFVFTFILWGISFLLESVLGSINPWISLIGLPVMVLSLFGLVAGMYIIPHQYCNVGFIGCDGLIGIVSTIILNLIFYFLIGALVGLIFEKSKANKKILIFVLAIAAVLIFALIFNKLFISHPPSKKINQQGTNQEQSQNQNQVANWKTYKKESLGFVFQYPEDWFVKDDFVGEAGIINITNYDPVKKQKQFQEEGELKIQISIYGKPEGQRLKDFVSNLTYMESSIKASSIKDINIGGVDGIYSNLNGDQYYLPQSEIKGVLIIIFNHPESKDYFKEYTDKFLSKFKIIKPIQLPVLSPITDKMIASFLENTPDKTVGSMTIKKTLRTDFDDDKREDAAVIVHECQATCYDNIYVFLNRINGLIPVDTSSVPLSKGIDVSLLGSQLEIRTFDLAGSLQTDQMYEVKDSKMVPVAGG